MELDADNVKSAYYGGNGLIFGSYLLLTLLPAGLNGKEEMEWKKSCESNN